MFPSELHCRSSPRAKLPGALFFLSLIKIVREYTALGLKDTKDLVEAPTLEGLGQSKSIVIKIVRDRTGLGLAQTNQLADLHAAGAKASTIPSPRQHSVSVEVR